MRISNAMVFDRMVANVETRNSHLWESYEAVSTGRRLRAPHDDPTGVGTALRLRSARSETAQYMKNADDGQTWIALSEAALARLGDGLQRARELVVANSSDTSTQSLREAAAKEIDAIIQHAAQLGNSTLGERFLFGGTATTAPPIAFIGPNQAQYVGDNGGQSREIAAGQEVLVNVTGDVAFIPSLNALRDVAADLRAGNIGQLSIADLQAVDAALDGVLTVRADLGARANRLEMAKTRLSESDIALATQQEELEDVDLSQAVLELNRSELAYRAALGAAARVAELTLLDFLR